MLDLSKQKGVKLTPFASKKAKVPQVVVRDQIKTFDEKEKAKQSVLDSLTDFAKLRFPTGVSSSISPNI
jgi:hypothetical protein